MLDHPRITIGVCVALVVIIAGLIGMLIDLDGNGPRPPHLPPAV